MNQFQPHSPFSFASSVEDISGLPGIPSHSLFQHQTTPDTMLFTNYPAPPETAHQRTLLVSERPVAPPPPYTARPNQASIDRFARHYACGFCIDAVDSGERVVCVRKNDLKRHMTSFHFKNTQWICQVNGCGRTFHRNKAYMKHVKADHAGANTASSPAVVRQLCPQRVFACGFERCERVFEATSDAGAEVTSADYLDHLMHHYGERFSSRPEWSYNTRFRNLLRQQGLIKVVTEEDFSREWLPERTSVLSRLLETGHFTSETAQRLIACIRVYAEPGPTVNQDQVMGNWGYSVPFLDSCKININGHKNLASNGEQTVTRRKSKATVQDKKTPAKRQQRRKLRATTKAKQTQKTEAPVVTEMPLPSPVLSDLSVPTPAPAQFTSSPEVAANTVVWNATADTQQMFSPQPSYPVSWPHTSPSSPTLSHRSVH